VYGNPDQIAENQEAVRKVRQQKTLIEEAHLQNNAVAELH